MAMKVNMKKANFICVDFIFSCRSITLSLYLQKKYNK
jgi:hypothetical protein